MTASEFLEKVVAQYFNYNNAFIYIQRDINGVITGLYPLDFGSVEIKVDTANNLYVKFQFINGKSMTVLYDAVIHIKRHFNTHQLFGEDNSKALKEDLDLLHAVKAAIINSVKMEIHYVGLSILKEQFVKMTNKNCGNNLRKDMYQMQMAVVLQR